MVIIKILTEASGSLTSWYLIRAIKEAGYQAVASDITSEVAAKYLADSFILMPSKNDPRLWDKLKNILDEHRINIVIPSLDETLLGWAEYRKRLENDQLKIIISDAETIRICTDKWLTYKFFVQYGIPTPKTSLKQDYPLIKPRYGRGAKGIRLTHEPIDMTEMISQEYVEGNEYTIDVLCDSQSNPIYIVPRVRLRVVDGKSVGGMTVKHDKIIQWVQKICGLLPFKGPLNMQCIETADGNLYFIEINPRIAGGMALGFAASENWIPLIVNHFFYGKPIEPKPIKFGLKMFRYYEEIFV